MTTLTGLELRKAACEALGWMKLFPNGGWTQEKTQEACHWIQESDLPAIESDPAVSEPMFLEWCEKNNYWFTLDSCNLGGDARFSVRLDRKGEQAHGPVIHAATLSEARARAIVEASR